MILRNIFLSILIAVCDLVEYKLIYDKTSSPPHSVPASPLDMYYSVPLNQTISKPIIAYVRYRNGSVVTDGLMSKAVFTIESINRETAHRGRSKRDKWAESGGKLCQRAVWWKDFPERMDRSQAKERCGVYPNTTMLTVQAFRGKIIIDWIFHSHVSIPKYPRILRIMSQQLQIFIDTYQFTIFEPAARIVIVSQPPHQIQANHDFNITAEIRDQNNTLVTKGLDSVAFVELTVPYYYKTFYRTDGKHMLVKTTSIRLAGKYVIRHQSTQDLISRQRASGGIVKFINIRILDVVSSLKLNLTMLMARDPWIRIPICSSCYDDTKYYYISADKTEIGFRQLPPNKNIKPMTFTDVFRVTEQKLKSLSFSQFTQQYWNKWMGNGTLRVVRNIVVPGHMFLEARDIGGSIIYSGKDSSFQLMYQTSPKVCISSDATKHLSGGNMYIYFSICDIINKVQVRISTHNDTIYVNTPFFEVSGNINIAHFGNFASSGTGAQVDVHVNNFIKFAVQDVNQGLQAKSLSGYFGFKLKVHSYDTESDLLKASMMVAKLTSEEHQPADMMHTIISSITDEVTVDLNSEVNKINMPYISVSNTADEYTKEHKSPFFNRVCWSDSSIIRSVILAVKERLWTKLILVRTDKSTIGDTFRGLADEMGINIENEVRIPDFSAKIKYLNEDLRLDQEMRLIKSFRTKIIFLFADVKTQPYILRAAYLSGIDSEHGYQWVLIPKYAWQFPFLNPGVCARGPKKCTVAFKGTILFSETYNISGYMQEDWIRTIGRYYSTDRFNLLGGRSTYDSPEIAAKKALGYDAVILFANALIQILTKDKSLTGELIGKALRDVEVEGLTGKINLNERGDRTGYLGFIAQVWPESDDNNVAMHDVLVPVRLLLTYQKNIQYEIPYKMNHRKNGFFIVPSLKYNTRKYKSFTGSIHTEDEFHIPRPGEYWLSHEIDREEKVIPPFYCFMPCGKNLLSDENINIYDTGECTAEGTCSCHRDYTGKECKVLKCNCKYGVCISSKDCRCFPGWSGTVCDIAMCSKCVHGECVEPETCQCNSTIWIGYACHIHLATVLTTTLLISSLLILFMIYCTRKVIRKIRRNAKLTRVDWIVEWSMLTPTTSSDTSLPQSILYEYTYRNKPIETYAWKNENWYVKSFDNRTMDPKDEDLHLEMLRLTELRHRNLIVYAGACLKEPNVCLLLEPAPKGSLTDLLLNDDIELGWNFRYSFMKDICLGMEYLHGKPKLGTHGRLKSQNCLVDSYWTIRISGFGAPSMRFKKYRKESEDKVNIKQLLWTAPELLRQSTCLDDVRNGTRAGDVYSFAIVLCEIVTRSEPYDHELAFIEVSILIDLILGNNYPGVKEARRVWEDIGGADMLIVRPILKKKFMPEQASVRKRFKKMLEDAWHYNPVSRPTFETLIDQLRIICPVKGELMDNVLQLLEAHSNNLEMIVMERTEELETNKVRAEELLRQMLPVNVSSELKQGRKVIPEIYECATAFFSDIVDFTCICQRSSPLQIVSLLNETYNVFDAVLDGYDVYKVGTTSDSYMVVSGMPLRNGNRHAGEICTMALDLMSTVTTFIIPDRPKATLQLRIGINSGPVVGGVVGLLMPRYCLFGDTVNIAARMMTGSHALCIQISDTTADLLEELGGYDMECRGEGWVKGSGMMTTYWLWGKENFGKILPEQSLAISLSQHTFK